MRVRSARVGVLVTVVATMVIAVMAQRTAAGASMQDGRENPLTSITGLRCRFTVSNSVLWKDGRPDVQTTAVDSQLVFSSIDIQDGTADIGAGQGRRFATTVLSGGALFLMESTRGGLDVTTVFGTETSPGKLKAVRAHHEYVFLTVPPFSQDPVVSQSYGECEPTAAGRP